MPEECCRTCAQPYSACHCPPPPPPDTLAAVVLLQHERLKEQVKREEAEIERITELLRGYVGLPAMEDARIRAAKAKIVREQVRKIVGPQTSPRPGRPPGRTGMSEAEFQQIYPEMYEQLLHDYATPPKRKEVAEALHIDPDTLHTYLRNYGLRFPPF